MTLRLLREGFRDDPALDTALSRALLARVAAGALPETFRLARPGAMVSFGRLDALAPGFEAATAAAARQGFAAIHRVGGGRAAVFHEETILVGHATRGRGSTRERFARMAGRLREALRALGVDAAVGALPREYCPGDHSLHAGGVKLAGIAQRVVRGAAWTEGVVVVGSGARVREVLVPVYAALELDWDPATAGAVEDLVPGVRFEDAEAAIQAELGAHEEATLDPETVALAESLRAEHDAAGGARRRAGDAERAKVAGH